MKEVLVLSDLHYGSKYGMSINPKNIVQERIAELWNDMLDDVESRQIEGVITLGDMTDGNNYKGGGKGLDTADKLEQIMGAKACLDMIPCKKIFSVGGSPYHTGSNLSDDEVLAKMVGAKFGEELVVSVDDARIHCSHKVGVTSAGTMYRSTPIAKEMMLAVINEAEYGKFNAILRGHAHYYIETRTGSQVGIICPCWKGRDEFAQQRSLGMVPHIGYVILKIKGKNVYAEAHTTTLKGIELIKEVVL